MDNRALSVPGLAVNNTPIEIVPNSYKYKGGFGEINVRAASAGGGASRTIHTEDAESKVGMMSWQMYVTSETEELVSNWKQSIGSNFISAQQPGSAPRSMGNASMTNDPDFEANADGTVEIMFSGDQLASNF